MHKLYKLKEDLISELENIGSSGVSKSNIEMIDKLAHAAKNVGKVIECCEEEEYSMAMGGGYSRRDSYNDDYSADSRYVRPDGSYRDSSYARGRGRNARRDSMGRYSGADDGTIQSVRQLLNRTQDESARQELSKLLDKLETM